MWDRIQAELERARRELLLRELGSGPRTSRIAQLEVQATLLELATAAFEEQARRFDEAGLVQSSRALRQRMPHLAEMLAEYVRTAARLEAEQLACGDGERYASLRAGVQHACDPVALRNVANEVVQASERVGERPAAALWRAICRRCAELRLDVPRDLGERFRREQERLAEREPAPQRATALPLLGEVERLAIAAPLLARDELFDQIELCAARLKILQEDPAAALDRTDQSRVKRAFSILTQLSKELQPGWTPTLDSRRSGEEWARYAESARRRIEQRARRRQELQEEGRREQLADALRAMRERERAIVFNEALERVRAKLYLLRAMADVVEGSDELARARVEIRTQAAIALSAAGGPEHVTRLAEALADQQELVASGRRFRALHRLWRPQEDVAELEAESADASEADGMDEAELQETTADIAQTWPAEVQDAQGMGEGESVLLVGGLPNDERRRLLQEFFGWRAAEWHESYRERQADFQGLRARVRDGRFDRVIVLARFCGHDVSTGMAEVCRRSGVAYHVHPRGISIPALAMHVYGAGLAV
ncbi:MAG: hypothetical protein KBD01_17375 [Acidobacteria bacterium]|nr:hypothetical protein [Acidobacteriota bacterium]